MPGNGNVNISFRFKFHQCLAGGQKDTLDRIHVPARSPWALACHGFINVLRHIRDFGRRRTRSKGTRKRFRGRPTCRRLLRLSPAPAHYLAIWQEDSQRPGKNMECPENGKVVCPVFGGIKCPAVSRSKFVFYTCRPDAYTINIAPDGSVLSENPKDGNLRCTDMLTRSVVHDGIFYVLKRAVVISHNGLYG